MKISNARRASTLIYPYSLQLHSKSIETLILLGLYKDKPCTLMCIIFFFFLNIKYICYQTKFAI